MIKYFFSGISSYQTTCLHPPAHTARSTFDRFWLLPFTLIRIDLQSLHAN